MSQTSLRIFESLDDWRKFRATKKCSDSLGFAPTMGALHSGHASLVERSKVENAQTAVSIFVNPTQFNNSQDLAKYPRTLDEDVRILRAAGADFLILPQYEELYADNFAFQVTETESSEKVLCGATRPGHFKGVLTVVLKLLNLVKASSAYFGEKDYQQLDLIRRMATAFFIDTEIVGCPTVRSAAGLALSSRNSRLTAAGLLTATRFAQEFAKDVPLGQIRKALLDMGLEIDYLEEYRGRKFAAVFVDGVRLIDNRATRGPSLATEFAAENGERA